MTVEKEAQLIASIREVLQDELKGDESASTDYAIQRWIHGWDFDYGAIVPRMRRCLQTRRALRLDKFAVEDPSEIKPKLDSVAPIVNKYYGVSFMCYDKESQPVVMMALGNSDAKGLSMSCRSSEFRMHQVCFVECVANLARIKERQLGKRLFVTAVIDSRGLTLDQMYMPAMDGFTRTATLLQQLYPETTNKILVVGAPALVTAAYTLIKPVLAKKTQQKIEFLGADWKQRLLDETDKICLEIIDSDNLPSHWGGTLPGDNPYGMVTMPSKIPQELWYKPENNKYHLDESELTSINIKAGTIRCVHFKPTDASHKQMAYFFRVANGSDITFSIWTSTNDDDENKSGRGHVVRPPMRHTTDPVPEWGTVDLSDSITGFTSETHYRFEFDNKFSWIRSKTVFYKIWSE